MIPNWHEWSRMENQFLFSYSCSFVPIRGHFFSSMSICPHLWLNSLRSNILLNTRHPNMPRSSSKTARSSTPPANIPRSGRSLHPRRHDRRLSQWTWPEQTYRRDGIFVTPGLIDIHVHFREPGDEEEETIARGSAAAVAGDSPPSAACPTPSRRWITRARSSSSSAKPSAWAWPTSIPSARSPRAAKARNSPRSARCFIAARSLQR